MTFAVTSNSFKDGDYLGQAHILSADFGSVAPAAINRHISRGLERRQEQRASPSRASTRMRPPAAASGIGWW